jgi:hypothetical protein
MAKVLAIIDVYDDRFNDGTLQAILESSESDIYKVNWLLQNCVCSPENENIDLEFGDIIIETPGYKVYYFDYGINEGIKLYQV